MKQTRCIDWEMKINETQRWWWKVKAFQVERDKTCLFIRRGTALVWLIALFRSSCGRINQENIFIEGKNQSSLSLEGWPSKKIIVGDFLTSCKSKVFLQNIPDNILSALFISPIQILWASNVSISSKDVAIINHILRSSLSTQPGTDFCGRACCNQLSQVSPDLGRKPFHPSSKQPHNCKRKQSAKVFISGSAAVKTFTESNLCVYFEIHLSSSSSCV